MKRTGVGAMFRLLGVVVMGLGVLVWVIGEPALGSASYGPLLAGVVIGGIGLIWYLAGSGVGIYYQRVAAARAADRGLFETGERAVAVIERVEDTGVAVNAMPVVWLHLRVRRANGEEFEHSEKVTTLASAVPQPGHVVDVAFDPGDRSQLALDVHPGLSSPPGVAVRSRPPDSDGPAHLDRLERLAQLHQAGALTDAEFADQKARILKGDNDATAL